ncbi:hypothetical protein quinque_008875 [Culex quinquefasciatus]|uniref:uncharacterized protein LOC119767495 n=1 Tax=Culex quinquefasciatus TaxID=7176 RepID=UPI0018E31366|nr:uncharacterized protein LOC119767495 [Culex quinquefasciatus]
MMPYSRIPAYQWNYGLKPGQWHRATAVLHSASTNPSPRSKPMLGTTAVLSICSRICCLSRSSRTSTILHRPAAPSSNNNIPHCPRRIDTNILGEIDRLPHIPHRIEPE